MSARRPGGKAGPEGCRPLGSLLDRIEHAARDGQPVSVGAMLDAAGEPTFSPLIVLSGLIMLAPGLGDIPGVPVIMGLVVILSAGQLLAQRDHVWLPRWLERGSVRSHRVRAAVRWSRPVAAFLDRHTRPRLRRLFGHAGVAVLAVSCIVIAAGTPVMELVPFSANVAGGAITAFGLALLTRDGVFALAALALSAATAGVVLHVLL